MIHTIHENVSTAVPDTGYTSICPLCCSRYGKGAKGPRDLFFKTCEVCENKKDDSYARYDSRTTSLKKMGY